MASRLTALADASDHKESLYAEAGDLLVSLPEQVTRLETVLDSLAYTLASLGKDQLRERLPLDAKFQVDRALADARLPPVADESNPILPPKTKTSTQRVVARYTRRVQADLSPPLGNPGGPCHVIQRIRDEVSNPRLQEALIEDFEEDGKLENPEASKVYEITSGEAPNASFIKQVLISAHGQFRMDQRGVTVSDVKQALQEFAQEYAKAKSNPRTKFLSDRWDQALAYGDKITYQAKRITIVFAPARTGGKGVIDLITTYPNGGSDPRPVPESACRLQ